MSMAWTHATGLDGLTRGLSTATGSGRPGEVSNRDDEEAVAAVGNTSQGVVPSGECSQETEETTRLDDGSVGLASRVPLQVTNTKQQEGQVQEQEEAEEGDSGPQGAEQQDSGEDEPALRRTVSAMLTLPAIAQNLPAGTVPSSCRTWWRHRRIQSTTRSRTHRGSRQWRKRSRNLRRRTEQWHRRCFRQPFPYQ